MSAHTAGRCPQGAGKTSSSLPCRDDSDLIHCNLACAWSCDSCAFELCTDPDDTGSHADLTQVTEISDALVMVREHAERLARVCDSGLDVDWSAVQYFANERDEIAAYLLALDHALADRARDLGQTFVIGSMVAISATADPDPQAAPSGGA